MIVNKPKFRKKISLKVQNWIKKKDKKTSPRVNLR